MVKYRNQFKQQPVEVKEIPVEVVVEKIVDESFNICYINKPIEEIQKLVKIQMKELCEEMGLDSSGTKSQLLNRIINHTSELNAD